MNTNLSYQPIEFFIIVCTVIMFLFIPKISDAFLELFDYSFTNFICILGILFTFHVNIYIAILFLLTYIFCIIQRRENISKEILNHEMSNIQINTDTKIKALIKILKNPSLSCIEKENLAIQAINSDIPNINKINVAIVFMKECPVNTKLLLNIYNSDNIKLKLLTHTLITKENKELVIQTINKSTIDIENKEKLLKIIKNKFKKVTFK